VQRIRALIEPPMTAADRDKALSKLDELIDSLREPGVQR
jgi:hypothetical protein